MDMTWCFCQKCPQLQKSVYSTIEHFNKTECFTVRYTLSKIEFNNRMHHYGSEKNLVFINIYIYTIIV